MRVGDWAYNSTGSESGPYKSYVLVQVKVRPPNTMKKKKLNGYILVYRPDHPRCMKTRSYNGWIYEHIAVAEEFLGRPLEKDEHVHHLDLNKSNNHPSNLLVLLASQHTKLHAFLRRESQSKEVMKCVVCGKDAKWGIHCSNKCKGFSQRKVKNRPSKEELLLLLEDSSFLAVGRMFGVSDNAIRKWLK